MGRVANDCAEAGLSEEQIYAIVIDMDTRWEKYIHRTDAKRRYIDIVERAKSKHPHGIDPALMLQSLIANLSNEKLIYNWKELADSKIQIKWFFHNLLSTTGYGNIYGPPGVGKTQFSLRMAIAAATGNDFLTWKNPSEKTRVLFFSLEMGAAPLKYFQSHIAPSLSTETLVDLEKNFFIIPTGEAMPLNKPEGRKFFEEMISQTKPGIVLIDSMSMLSTVSLNGDEAAIELISYLERVRNQYQCAMVVIHHDKKKQPGAPTGQDSMYGNRFLSARADFVLSLHGKYDQLRLEADKTRLGPSIAPMDLIRTEHFDFVSDQFPMNAERIERLESNFGGRLSKDTK